MNETLDTLQQMIPHTPHDALLRTEELLSQNALRAHEQVTLWQLHARALRALGRHQDALDSFDTAARQAAAGGDRLLCAKVRIGAIDSLTMLERYDEARALAHTLADELAPAAPLDAAKVEGNLGSLYLRCDDYARALACYRQAETWLGDLPAPMIRAGLLVNQAIAWTYQGQIDKALERYQQARVLYQNHGQPFDVAVVDANIGFLHTQSGWYATALTHLSTASRVFVDAGRETEAARCALDQGDAYRALNLLPEAMASYRSAEDAFTRAPLPADEARAELGIAAVALRQGRDDEAGAALDRAQTRFRQQGNEVQQAHVHLARAPILQRAGRSAEASRSARDAQRLFANHGLDGWAAEAQLAALRADGLPAASRLAPLAAIAHTAKQSARGWLECQTEREWGRALQELGRREEARLHLQHSVEALESLRARIALEDLHLAYLSDKEDVYQELIALLLEGESTPEEVAAALQTLERSRSRLLLERLLRSLPLAPDADPARGKSLERLRAALSRAYRDASALATDEPQRRPAHALARLPQLEARYAKALRDTAIAAPPARFPRGETPSPPEEIQAALAPDETLLLYSQIQERLGAFVVRHDQIHALPNLAPWNTVRRAVRRFRYHLQKRNVPSSLRHSLEESLQQEMDHLLAELYTLLLAPIMPLLAGPRLRIVPCGLLQRLPIHALRDGDDAVLDRFEVSYAPSASVWHALTTRPKRKSGPRATLLVGHASPGAEQVLREIDSLTRSFPDAQVLRERQATVGAVEDHMPGRALIHLATHALFREDNPLFSGLQLADGWLLARDLYRLSLDAELVTLSACETAAARVEAGEEWMGLARGFLAAGAQNVVASLWPADDDATAALMTRFYALLAAGNPPGAALRQAQRALRRERPHLYHWAAFCLIGRG